jgi:hypothetical protein
MISDRKLQANRLNARRSTGPKTPTGRAIASRNARRHGLRIPVLSDPALSAEVEAVARRIVDNVGISDRGALHLLELARPVAEAQVDLQRVRLLRGSLIAGVPDLLDQFVARPDGLNGLHDFATRIRVVDRYERRTLSRRMSAIRDFEAACLAACATASSNDRGERPQNFEVQAS